MGYSVLEENQVQQVRLSSHEAVLAVSNDCVVLKVFLNTSQNNNFHTFTKHCSETDRLVFSGAVLLALFKNQDTTGQLPVSWDLCEFPRWLKN